MMISPQEFLKSIPNRDVMYDFLTNEMQMYCPPQKEMTTKFISEIIAEEKFLLPLAKVQRVYNVP
jgi:hypothetical protein